jgi:EmrB/QacA subfamily drug resistance transporter
MRKWSPLIAICLGTFMLLIDVTIVNVALPDMASSIHTSFSALQWVIDAYALALAALLLGIGAVADLAGHRKSYIAGLLLFAVSSLVCGLSPNAGTLIAARVVQGVGAAAMFATTSALLNTAYRGRDRGTAYGWWGAVAGAAAAVGPVIGGILVEAISWRWIFFVNIPITAVAIAMTLKVLPDDQGDRSRRVDLPGILTFTAAAGCLTYALIRANEHGWATTPTYILLGIAAVSLAAFIVIESTVRHPMLDLSLFRRQTFVGTMLSALLINFVAFSALTYSSIWLQSVIGLSPLAAGFSSLPLAAVSFVTSAAGGKLVHDKPRFAIAGGMLFAGVGSLLVALVVRQGSSWPELIPGFVVIGLGVGLAMPVLVSSAMSAVPVQSGGMAGGAVNTARQLGYAIGIAVLGSVFAARAASDLSGPDKETLAHELAGGHAPVLLAQAGPNREALSRSLHHAAISGIDGAFLVAGIAGIVTALVVSLLLRGRPHSAEPTPTTATAEGELVSSA